MVLQKKLKLRRMDMDMAANNSSSVSDWAGLPVNILDLILDKLVSLKDYIRFGSVCLDWNTVANEDRNHWNRRRRLRDHHNQLPMLMIPTQITHKNFIHSFYTVACEEVLDFQLCVPYLKRFIGCSFGWLISVDAGFTITLFNPFSNNTILLAPPFGGPELMNQDGNFDYLKPPFNAVVFNHEYFFVKAILSADPTLHPHQYILMVIYGSSRRLAFIAPGLDKASWVFVETSNELQGFHDVIYTSSDGLFYALRESGEVLSIEIDLHRQCKVATARVKPTLRIKRRCAMRYVVESCGGDLLQVLRFEEFDEELRDYFTSEFRVFKCHTDLDWIELKSLGDEVLFLGDSTSLSVLASDFPGCRRGSIYFSLGFDPELLILKQPYVSSAILDMGMITLESGWFDPLNLDLDTLWSDAMLNLPPIWVMPTFQDARVKRLH